MEPRSIASAHVHIHCIAEPRLSNSYPSKSRCAARHPCSAKGATHEKLIDNAKVAGRITPHVEADEPSLRVLAPKACDKAAYLATNGSDRKAEEVRALGRGWLLRESDCVWVQSLQNS